MKIYISVDMEGVCGTTSWDDVTKGKVDYSEFQRQVTQEVSAACEGALSAGATEIVVNDAHDTARNLIAADLPEKTQLIRGWSYHPYMMMQELNTSFDAALCIGYHSYAGSGGSPLTHTMAMRIASITLNNQPVSEFLISCYTAALEQVPLIFISGDQEICEHATEIIPGIETVAVKSGIGRSTINIHPQTACERIRNSVQKALSGTLPSDRFDLPEKYAINVSYKNPADAYKAAFYPGAEQISPTTVKFETSDYFEVLRLFLFIL